MVNSIANNEAKPNFIEKFRDMLFMLSGFFLLIIGLTIFQDFLESKRNGYAFYFNESLLFKTIWFLFIPILAVLYKKLKNETLDSYGRKEVRLYYFCLYSLGEREILKGGKPGFYFSSILFL